MTECKVDGCDQPKRSLEMCQTHYKRHFRGVRVDAPVKRRRLGFWAYVEKTDGCWLWTGAQEPGRYGRYGVPGKSPALVHRYAYEELVGPIPSDMTIDHLCRVKTCVNPAHMEVVTRGENTRRAARARRQEKAAA